jgi:hypothetical protein
MISCSACCVSFNSPLSIWALLGRLQPQDGQSHEQERPGCHPDFRPALPQQQWSQHNLCHVDLAGHRRIISVHLALGPFYESACAGTGASANLYVSFGSFWALVAAYPWGSLQPLLLWGTCIGMSIGVFTAFSSSLANLLAIFLSSSFFSFLFFSVLASLPFRGRPFLLYSFLLCFSFFSSSRTSRGHSLLCFATSYCSGHRR